MELEKKQLKKICKAIINGFPKWKNKQVKMIEKSIDIKDPHVNFDFWDFECYIFYWSDFLQKFQFMDYLDFLNKKKEYVILEWNLTTSISKMIEDIKNYLPSYLQKKKIEKSFK